MTAILLTGFMGAGKTTVGRLLAARLDRPHLDLDEVITTQIGCSIQHFFEHEGEQAFRQLETALLAEMIQQEAVLSTGGGIITRPENRQLLAKEKVIYLAATPEVFLTRIQSDEKNKRPLVVEKTAEELTALYLERQAWYEVTAQLTILTDNKTPAMIVSEIIQEMGEDL